VDSKLKYSERIYFNSVPLHSMMSFHSAIKFYLPFTTMPYRVGLPQRISPSLSAGMSRNAAHHAGGNEEEYIFSFYEFLLKRNKNVNIFSITYVVLEIFNNNNFVALVREQTIPTCRRN
jgi:hypothetical protein